MKSGIPGTRTARVVAWLLVASFVVACGGSPQDTAAEKKKKADAAAPAGGQAAVEAGRQPGDERLANAVVTAKTSAPVDLRYEFAAKPVAGQPFELQLVFAPRAAAEALEVEMSGIEGLTLVSSGTMRFENVQAGERYTGKVLAQVPADGLYYIGLSTKMISKVQTEVRTFAVPIVVGTAPAAVQKAAPAKDAAGQPIESMPAVESGGPAKTN